MAEILDKMVDFDVIVMATPAYFYTVCGQMKTLIDPTYDICKEIQINLMVKCFKSINW